MFRTSVWSSTTIYPRESREGRDLRFTQATELDLYELTRASDISSLLRLIRVLSNRENYIHRIGRSGRFGRKGVAINFVTSEGEFLTSLRGFAVSSNSLLSSRRRALLSLSDFSPLVPRSIPHSFLFRRRQSPQRYRAVLFNSD